MSKILLFSFGLLFFSLVLAKIESNNLTNETVNGSLKSNKGEEPLQKNPTAPGAKKAAQTSSEKEKNQPKSEVKKEKLEKHSMPRQMLHKKVHN